MGQFLTAYCDDCMRVEEEEKKSRRSSSLTDETDREQDFLVDPSEEQFRSECAKVLMFYDLGRCVGRGATSKVYEVVRKFRPASTSSSSSSNRTTPRRFPCNEHTIKHAQLSSSSCDSRRNSLACKVIDKRRLIGLTSNTVDNESVLGQLRKEIAILKSIDHPNIVAFQDFIETTSFMYLVTEYARGDELFERLARHGPLSEHLAQQVMRGVFSAVSYLHERGVLHRDIKAENVIIQLKALPEGGIGVASVKLIDFGFSTMLRRTDMTGSFLGTGGYLAPEIRQQRLYGLSIDNWALGTLLFCTIAGHLPFGSDFSSLPVGCTTRSSCQKIFSLHMEGAKWNHISRSCKNLIRKLLEVDPVRRLTARQALWHPWLKELTAPLSTTTPTSMHTSHGTARCDGTWTAAATTARQIWSNPVRASRPQQSTVPLSSQDDGGMLPMEVSEIIAHQQAYKRSSSALSFLSDESSTADNGSHPTTPNPYDHRGRNKDSRRSSDANNICSSSATSREGSRSGRRVDRLSSSSPLTTDEAALVDTVELPAVDKYRSNSNSTQTSSGGTDSESKEDTSPHVSLLRPIQSTMILETASQHTYYSKLHLPSPMSLTPTMTRAQSTTPSMDAAGTAMDKNFTLLTTKSLLETSSEDDAEEWQLEAECDIECDQDMTSRKTALPVHTSNNSQAPLNRAIQTSTSGDFPHVGLRESNDSLTLVAV